MATSFPGGVDNFPVPDLPQTTSLSSAGSGTRAHTDHHRDLGAAIAAIEANVALKGHDHSGDGTDRTKGAKLAQANTHQSADTDVAVTSIHHTIDPTGASATAAAAANHVHDYNGPTIVGKPYQLCLSTSRPPVPYKGLQIYETDTDRVRVWGSFLQNSSVTGTDGTENWDGTAGTLSSTNWFPTVYDQGDTGHGQMLINGTGQLYWADNTGFNNRAWARRKLAADRYTLTDDQVITWKTGDTVIEDILLFTEGASNDKYFRVSDDELSWWRLAQGSYGTTVYYATNGKASEAVLGTLPNVDSRYANMEWRGELVNRTLSLWRGGVYMGSIVDTNNSTARGPANRGWMVGLRAGQRGLGQTTPASEQWVRIQDKVIYDTINRWTILPVAKFPIVRLRQSSTQSINPVGSIMEWNEVLEDGFGYFDSAVKTDIAIKEPGLYQIDAAVQWDPNFISDQVYVILCINGVETTVRKQAAVRGGTLVPGFSQTVDLSGKLRFGPGDVLSVKAAYYDSGGLLGWFLSFFQPESRINSRIDVAYMGV